MELVDNNLFFTFFDAVEVACIRRKLRSTVTASAAGQ
jgi:hypothetical protein